MLFQILKIQKFQESITIKFENYLSEKRNDLLQDLRQIFEQLKNISIQVRIQERDIYIEMFKGQTQLKKNQGEIIQKRIKKFKLIFNALPSDIKEH